MVCLSLIFFLQARHDLADAYICCIADMGLGKTLQALLAVALAHCDNRDHCNKPLSLVVCPSTLVAHWTAEIAKYFPVTEQAIFCALGLTGNRSMREAIWQNRSTLVNIIVTSYSTLRSDIEYLERESFCYCILDEGHLMKNPKTGTFSERERANTSSNLNRLICYLILIFCFLIFPFTPATARASRRIRAKHKLVLTGTPVQNRVNELWAVSDGQSADETPTDMPTTLTIYMLDCSSVALRARFLIFSCQTFLGRRLVLRKPLLRPLQRANFLELPPLV